MTTLRKWLDSVDFDWSTGKVLIQSRLGDWNREDDYYEDLCKSDSFQDAWTPRFVLEMDSILDYEFPTGFGSPKAPCFIAEDSEKLYFPSQYDGSTSIETINKDISTYLQSSCTTPYPGG
jgi:hypothetical protein